MWFSRTTERTTPDHPHAGRPAALDGATAVLGLERHVSDVRVVQASAAQALGTAPINPSASGQAERVMADVSAAAGLAAGYAATGLRAAVVVGGEDLGGLREALATSAAQRQAYVVHHLAGASHDAGALLAGTGAFHLAAASVQEAADLTLIARDVAERALTPGVVTQELSRTAQALQTVRLPEAALADVLLGRAADEIATPTPAQELLFGPRRPRLPALIDLDRPLGLGGRLTEEAARQASAARDVFFAGHLPALVDEAMATFAEETGRPYARAAGYRLDDADVVVVAQGSLTEALRGVVDELRRSDGLRAGLLSLTLVRPFPGDVVTELLRGCRAVTVLACTEQAPDDDPLLLADVRAALGRAAENGRAQAQQSDAKLPYPDHAVYARAANQPRLFAGTYAGGAAHPTFDELCAVFYNMLPDGPGHVSFHLGARLAEDAGAAESAGTVRLPALERRRQRLLRGYPEVLRRMLPGTGREAPHGTDHAFAVRTVAEDAAANVQALGRALFRALEKPVVEARPEGSGPARSYTVTFAEVAMPPVHARTALEALVATSPAAAADRSVLARLQEGAAVVVRTPRTAAEVWAQWRPEIRRVLRERRLRLYLIDAAQLAEAEAPVPGYAPLLHWPALWGAFLHVWTHVEEAEGETEEPAKKVAPARWDALVEAYEAEMAAVYGDHPALVEAHGRVLRRAAEAVTLLDPDALAEPPAPPEPEAPWPVRDVPAPAERLHDLTRLWNDVGFLHATGAHQPPPADPFAAVPATPARSSAFARADEDVLPELLPENCTACGRCWALCPDTALPSTVQDVGALVGAAVEAAEADRGPLLQVRRLQDHLARQAHRLVVRDDLHRYGTLDALVAEAFRLLADRMDLAEEKRAELEAEMQAVVVAAEGVVIARTERYFEAPERAEAGSGLLLSMAVDPDACQACGLCVEACPEDALAWQPRAPEVVERRRKAGAFLRALPEVPLTRLEAFVEGSRGEAPGDAANMAEAGHEPEALAAYLLNRRVYQARLGGDGRPGDSTRTALHLAVGMAEALVQPRVEALRERIDGLIAQCEEEIARRLQETVRVNDLDAFGRRLTERAEEALGLDDLAALVPEAPRLDREAVQRLTGVLADLKALRDDYAQAAHGDGRARLAAAFNGAARPQAPYNPFPFPWVHHLSGEAPAVAEGLYEGLMRRMAHTFRTLRRAELLASGAYDPSEHEAFLARFSATDFSAEERAACPPVLVVTGRMTEAVARLLRGDVPIKVVLLNGADRPARAPEEAAAALRREPALEALAERRAFVLQSTVGTLGHLLGGLRAGLAYDGPALFHLYAPDPAGHGLPAGAAYAQAQQAVASRAVPLLAYDPAAGEALADRLSLEGNPEEAASTLADWAAREGRFRALFQFVPRPAWSPAHVPVADYLALPAAERSGKTPYVTVPGADERPVRLAVAPALVAAAEARAQAWDLLEEMAGRRSAAARRWTEAAEAETAARLEAQRAELEAAHTAALAEVEAGHAAHYHALLTRRLLALGRGGEAEATLRAYARGEETPC